MKNLKRVLSRLLCLIMVVGLVPMTALAEASTPTVIDEIHIGGVTMPVVGATPINSATTSTPGVTIGSDTFWVRYVPETNDLKDLYDDSTYVDSTPFRSGVKYSLQVMLESKAGFTIAPDAKIFYNGIQLPAPDASDMSKSCADIVSDGTRAMALISGEASVPTTYTVNFDSDGGSAVAAQTVESDKTATKPADPAKSGYTFKGWTLDGVAYDFSTPVTDDITLKAKWEAAVPIKYAVEVTLNGYSLGAKVADAYVSESSDTVDFYDFKADGTFFRIFEDDGTGRSDWESTVTQFEADKDYWLVVALAKPGGDALPEAELDADNATLVNGCVDKFTVYDDDLWWIEFKLSRLSAALPNVYTITFDAAGGSVTPGSATTGNDGKLTSLPTPTHTNPSAVFDGWYTGKTGDIKVTTDTVFTSNTTVYAHWDVDYAIEVTLNGYELGKKVADTTLTENSDTLDIDRENCHIFTEEDGEPDWSSTVTEFEANKDYWLVIALTKQGGDALTDADLGADDVDLTNDYTKEQLVYDDDLWWVSYKLKRLDTSVPATYTATVENGTGDGDYTSGATVTVTADTIPGKLFREWTTSDSVAFADSKDATTTFTMPDKDVTVTAVYDTIISVIDISGITEPVAGAVPSDSFTISTTGVEVGSNTFWQVYDEATNTLKASYADSKIVNSEPFRAGTCVKLQAEVIAKKGYVFTPDTVIRYNGVELPVKDDSNLKPNFRYPVLAEHRERTAASIGWTVEEPDANTATIVVKKTDEEGKTLAGAKFILESSEDEYEAVSNASGLVTFRDVKPGYYTLSETDAPEGYIKTSKTWNFTVREDGTVNGFSEALPNGYAYNNDQPIEIENEKIQPSQPVIVEIPVTKAVRKGGNTDFSGSETFEFEVEALNSNVDADKLTITGNSVTVTNMQGGSTTIKISIPGDMVDDVLSEGLQITEKAGTAQGWTYSTESYLVVPSDTGWSYYLEGETANTAAETIVFTNTYTKNNAPVPTTSVTVNKVWAGNLPNNMSHPTSVTVFLKANGTKVAGSEITLNANKQWTHTWEDLPAKDANGRAIEYMVGENAVANYTASIAVTDAVNQVFKITNTWNPTIAPVKYTVTYKANGGSDTMTSDTVDAGTEYTIRANGFTAPSGKKFKCWKIGTKEYDPGEKITVNSDVTITAVWKNKTSGGSSGLDYVPKTGDSSGILLWTALGLMSAMALAGVEIYRKRRVR